MITVATNVDHRNKLASKRDEIDFLIRKFLHTGEEEVFNDLFKRTYAPLCHFAVRLVHEKSAAEEVVSDVFLKLWKNRKFIEINTSAKSYLYTSVRNKSLDFLRKEKRNSNLCGISEANDLYDVSVSVIHMIAYQEMNAKVQNAMCELPPKCQEIFRLSREHGLRYAEIADELELSVKTIETQMGRALKHMRERLKFLKLQ